MTPPPKDPEYVLLRHSNAYLASSLSLWQCDAQVPYVTYISTPVTHGGFCVLSANTSNVPYEAVGAGVSI